MLGIFNYRQARRDTYHLRAAVTTSNFREQDGTILAYDFVVEITNTDQRPVTITDLALV